LKISDEIRHAVGYELPLRFVDAVGVKFGGFVPREGLHRRRQIGAPLLVRVRVVVEARES
jgi:hypothetical protein